MKRWVAKGRLIKLLKKFIELVNSISIKGVYERMVTEEAKLKGVITTEEEYKAFNVIKTILAMSSKFRTSEA